MSDMTSLQAINRPRDIGEWAAEQALTAVGESITALELDMPRDIISVGGTGVPVQDVCAGQMFARVGAAFPTLGDGTPFEGARIDGLVPAWAWMLHIGILWCRSVIDPDGEAVSAEKESDYARRDSDYRMALLDGLYGRWGPAIAPCVNGIRWGQWAPIGPDGGVSGGLIEITLVATALAITGPC